MLASHGRTSLFVLSFITALGCSEPVARTDAASQGEAKAKTEAGEPSEASEAGEAGEAKTASTPVRPEGELLTLGDAKIMREGHEDRAIVIRSNGGVTLAGAPFGVVSKDGKVTSTDRQLMMEVQGDGTVVTGAGPTGIVINEEGGSLRLPKLQVQIRFGDDGKIDTQVSGPHAALLGTDSPALVTEGCTGAVTKTCALITLAYLMALGNPETAEEAPQAG